MKLLAQVDMQEITGLGKMVFHQSPIRRSVFFEPIKEDEDEEAQSFLFKENYFLSFPDILFVAVYKKNFRSIGAPNFISANLYAVMTNKDCTEYGEFPFPNFFDDLSVCLDYGNFQSENPEEVCRQIIKQFWDSKFDLSSRDTLMEDQFGSLSGYSDFLDDWESKTKSLNWVPEINMLREQPDRYDPKYTHFLVMSEMFDRNLDLLNSIIQAIGSKDAR